MQGLKEIVKDKFSDKWWEKLSHHFDNPYMEQLYSKIQSDVKKGYKVLPSSNDIYQRFKLINPEDVRIVFLTENPICSYAQSLEWRNISSWMERECFDGLNLNLEDNMDYLINQGIINLSPSLTVCNKSDHSDIGWEVFTEHIVDILRESNNNVLFVSGNEKITEYIMNSKVEKFELIPLQPGCFNKINEFMQVNYNTKISW